MLLSFHRLLYRLNTGDSPVTATGAAPRRIFAVGVALIIAELAGTIAAVVVRAILAPELANGTDDVAFATMEDGVLSLGVDSVDSISVVEVLTDLVRVHTGASSDANGKGGSASEKNCGFTVRLLS